MASRRSRVYSGACRACLQQVLGVLHRCAQAEAYAQQAVAGGEAAAGEQLVQIYLADTGLLGQRGLGEAGGGIEPLQRQL